jgi:hypothetical protein
MINLFVKKKIAARVRRNDGTDQGFCYLTSGKYLANNTSDGYVQIIRPNEDPLYLMALIFSDKIKNGEIAVLNDYALVDAVGD